MAASLLVPHLELFLATNSKVVAWGCGCLGVLGIPSFLAAEDIVSKLSVGTGIGVLGVLAGVAGAYFKNKGGMIKARSDADVAASEVLARATEKLIAQTTEQHTHQITMLRDDLKFARDRADRERAGADEETIIGHNERAAKHAALEELNSLNIHRYLLEDILRQARIAFPQGPATSYARIISMADKSIGRVVEKRVALSAAVVEANVVKRETQRIDTRST